MAIKLKPEGIKQALFVIIAMMLEILAIATINPPQTPGYVGSISFISVIIMIGLLPAVSRSWIALAIVSAISFVEFFIGIYIVKTLPLVGIWNIKTLAVGLVFAVANALLASYLKKLFLIKGW